MEQCMPANAPWPGWSLTLALSFDCYLTLFHWGCRADCCTEGECLEEKQRLFPPAMVQIPLQQGRHLQQAAAGFSSQADHRAELWHSEVPLPAQQSRLQSTHLSLGATSTHPWAHPSSCQGHPAVLVPASPDVAWKEWLGHWLSRLKFGSECLCYLCRPDMSLCPEPCGPDSSPCIYKTLLMCTLLLQVLDSNGITHMCTHTQGSAGQGQILLPSADLHHTLERKIWHRSSSTGEGRATWYLLCILLPHSHLCCHWGSLQEGLLPSTIRALLHTRG